MVDINKVLDEKLRINCEKCFGFCCTALYFSKLDGFPQDKEGGKPCINLQNDFRCKIHSSLNERGLKGCISYDCFGAGQKTAQVTFNGQDYIKKPELAQEMFDVFLIIRQLHEMVWYLIQSLDLVENKKIKNAIEKMIEIILDITSQDAKSILKLDLDSIRDKVNVFIREASESIRKNKIDNKKINNIKSKKLNGEKKNYIGKNLTSYDLRCADLRGSLLIAADLRNSDLSYSDFIGSDVRDCNVSGADLSKSLFLTQAQLNTMKGNSYTKVPKYLKRPDSWGK